MNWSDVEADLKLLSNKEKADFLPRFFKTGPGEYGEGDIFWGIRVPEQRKVAIKYQSLNLKDLAKLLKSPIHECRLTALLILIEQYKKATFLNRGQIYDFYLKNRQAVNNWDLVDSSAGYILGAYMLEANLDLSQLIAMAKSTNMWDRRMAIIATQAFIKAGNIIPTIKISDILLNDSEDLLHKAVGWMLREAHKINPQILEPYIYKNAAKMPRTMLRYAIEKFPEKKRQEFLKIKAN